MQPDEETTLKMGLKAIDDEEAGAARLYASGKITDKVWDEWQNKRRTIQDSLPTLGWKHETHSGDRDASLTIISKVGMLYNNLDRSSQRDVLREIISKIVVYRTGNIVAMELLFPCAYLKRLTDTVKREANSEGTERNEKSGVDAAVPKCSDYTASGGPEGCGYVN